MYVVCVSVWVESGHEDDFIEATRLNHLGTRQEPGNVRFDVLRNEAEPSRFFLYEVYRSADDFKTHQQTDHYLGWKQTVAGWMERKREGLKNQSLFPPDETW